MEEKIYPAIVIDIEELENYLKSNFDHHSITLCNINVQSKATICTVQKFLRDVYYSDYEPVVVSIGPYHHGNQKLKDLEKIKWKTLEYILKVNTEKSLHDYIQALRVLYPTVRSYYAGDMKMPGNTFVHVLLLDQLFVVAFVCGLERSLNNPNLVQSAASKNFDKRIDPLEYGLVIRDFFLLENQIPFIIIKRLHELFSCKDNIFTSLLENFAKFSEQFFPGNLIPVGESERAPMEIYHLLHLCHMYLRPNLYGDYCDQQLDYRLLTTKPAWHQAVEYHFAGVKLKKKDDDETNPHSLLDVSFFGDILQIPNIFVDENTTIIFRNPVALEQANIHIGNHISTYIVFISQLVSSTEDVALLVNQGIIGHHFENEEQVSNIFTSLGDCVVFDFSGSFYRKNI